MIDPFFDFAVFFFAAPRNPGAFERFCLRFGLPPSQLQGPFEITDDELGKILHKEDRLSDMLDYLNTNPARSFDFYLIDNDGEIFTFSYRPIGCHVMSVPYRILNRYDPKEILDDFQAVYGWGAGQNSPPPNSIDEIKASTSLESSPFIRYSEGKFTLRSGSLE